MPAKGKRAMQNGKRIEKEVGKGSKRKWEKDNWKKDSGKEVKERFESKGIKKIDCKEEDICPAIGIFAVQINQQL